MTNQEFEKKISTSPASLTDQPSTEVWAYVCSQLAKWDLIPIARNALHFGCGKGEITANLSKHFAQISGVDTSESLILDAKNKNISPGQINFLKNSFTDLRIFPEGTFDFVFSYSNLPHFPPRVIYDWVREFLRVLTPGGVLVFQLVSNAKNKKSIPEIGVEVVKRFFSGQNPGRYLRPMYPVPRANMESYLRELPIEILHVESDPLGPAEWESTLYLVRK